MADDRSQHRYQAARDAFRRRDVAAARRAHQIGSDPHAGAVHGLGMYVGDAVFGATDGIVTTFAVVSGVVGAELPAGIILILGAVNLLADGLSMAVGNYLGTQSERDYHRLERERERWEIAHLPDEERDEVREIFSAKGVEGEDLDDLVRITTRYPKVWEDLMMTEELNISKDEGHPAKHGLATFVAFVIAGSVPLLAPILGYLFPLVQAHSFPITIALTLLALFAVGVARMRVTMRNWWASGLEIMALGGIAAAVAYGVGWSLSSLAAG